MTKDSLHVTMKGLNSYVYITKIYIEERIIKHGKRI